MIILGVFDEDRIDSLVARFVTELNDKYGVTNIVKHDDECKIKWVDVDRCTTILKFEDVVVNDYESLDFKLLLR
jgi:hypothetical protein